MFPSFGLCIDISQFDIPNNNNCKQIEIDPATFIVLINYYNMNW